MACTYREFAESDYAECEALVNAAWDFDRVFQPQELADIAKKIYTRGSVVESSYRFVAEVDGQVAGFLFGVNESVHKPKRHLRLRLSILWRILRVKKSNPDKKELFAAMSEHEKNRAEHIGKHRSEIVLFVVSPSHQRTGIGKQLWSGFLENCTRSGVDTIVVETNKKGASSFYEVIGFEHLADFDSPLHEFATPNGQACVYAYKTLGDTRC